jgi:hypothetical protein
MELILTPKSAVFIINGDSPLAHDHWSRAFVSQSDLHIAIGETKSQDPVIVFPTPLSSFFDSLLALMKSDPGQLARLANFVTMITGRRLFFLQVYPYVPSGPVLVINFCFLFDPLQPGGSEAPVTVQILPEVRVAPAFQEGANEYPIAVTRASDEISKYPPWLHKYPLSIEANGFLKPQPNGTYQLVSLGLDGQPFFADCVWRVGLVCEPSQRTPEVDETIVQKLKRQTSWTELNTLVLGNRANSSEVMTLQARSIWKFFQLLDICQGRPLNQDEQRLIFMAYGYLGFDQGKPVAEAMRNCAEKSGANASRLIADELMHRYLFRTSWD